MSVFIDFAECKKVLTVPQILEACGVNLADYPTKNGRLIGPCPLPSHPTSCQQAEYRNKEQWVADDKKGYWLWHCFAPDCRKGGDVIELAKLMNDLDNQHVRRWLNAIHFGSKSSERFGASRRFLSRKRSVAPPVATLKVDGFGPAPSRSRHMGHRR